MKIEYWGGVSKQSGIGAGSGDALIYTLELTNAQVHEFRHFTAVDGTLCFSVGFTYQKIVITWKDGGITSQDDWLSVST